MTSAVELRAAATYVALAAGLRTEGLDAAAHAAELESIERIAVLSGVVHAPEFGLLTRLQLLEATNVMVGHFLRARLFADGTVGSSEEVLREVTKSLVDVARTTDVLGDMVLGKGYADPVAVAEALALVLGRSFDESVSIGAEDVLLAMARSLSDAASAADVLQRELSRVVADVVDASDSVQVGGNGSEEDFAAASDLAALAVQKLIDDAMAAVDAGVAWLEDYADDYFAENYVGTQVATF